MLQEKEDLVPNAGSRPHQKREDLVPNAGTRGPLEEGRSGPKCRLQPEDTVVVEGNVTIFTLGSWFDGDVDWRILISPKINQRLLTPRRYYTEWRKEISRIFLPVEIWGIPPPSRQMLDRIKCLSATRRDSLEIPLSESFPYEVKFDLIFYRFDFS